MCTGGLCWWKRIFAIILNSDCFSFLQVVSMNYTMHIPKTPLNYAWTCSNCIEKHQLFPTFVRQWWHLSHCKKKCLNIRYLYQVWKYETGIFLQKLHVCCMKMIKNILFKVISIAIYTIYTDGNPTEPSLENKRHTPVFPNWTSRSFP